MTKKKENCPICGRKRNTEGSCDNEFCKKHNYQHFRTLIKYFGFDKAKLGTVEVESEFNRVRNYLYDLYWNKNLSSTELAKMFNYTSIPTNITQKFFKNYLDIPVKSCKYAVVENFFSGWLFDIKYKFLFVIFWKILSYIKVRITNFISS